MGLVAVDSWACPKTMKYKGKYRNEDGQGLCGFYRRDYKKTTDMVVLSNGNVIIRYKYPKVDIPFKSPMMRWHNLAFNGSLLRESTVPILVIMIH